jgi:hypothetical protein
VVAKARVAAVAKAKVVEVVWARAAAAGSD